MKEACCQPLPGAPGEGPRERVVPSKPCEEEIVIQETKEQQASGGGSPSSAS